MFKDAMSLLAECAVQDLSVNTEGAIKESTIRSTYSNIPEVSEESVFEAQMVPVQKIGEDYMVEAYSIYPFMNSYGIKAMSEALDYVAEANNLPPKSVGLLIESQECVTDMIDCAITAAKESGNQKQKTGALAKVGKVEKLADALQKAGYKVKKKCSKCKK